MLFNGNTSEGLYVFSKFLLIFIFCLIIIHFLLKYDYRNFIVPIIIFSFLTSSIYWYQLILSYDEIMSISSNWKRNVEFDKLSSTMAHKNLLSSIQFLCLPFLLHGFLKNKKFIKWFSLLSIFLIVITYFQTQTRAVLGALFFSFLSIVFLNLKNIKLKYLLYFSLIVVVFSLSGYLIMKSTNRIDAFKSDILKVTEFKSSERYRLYKSTFNLIFDNPIIGVGPGQWKVDVWQYGLYFNTSGKRFAQRPHNDFLWVTAEAGIIAGLCYIILFLILIRDSYLIYTQDKKKNLIFCLFFSTLIGYAFISVVDFPMERFAHNILFFFIASIIISQKLKLKDNFKLKLPNYVMYLLLIISVYIANIAIVRYNSDIHATNAVYYKNKGNWNYVIKAVNKAYNQKYYQIDNVSTPLLWYKGIAYFNQNKFDLAFDNFKKAYQIHPNHVHVLNNLATLFEIKKNSLMAKKYYNDALKVNPSFKEVRVNLAAILFNEKKYIEALDVILQSKVEPFWKRKQNKDNYDLYLKTIVLKWANTIKLNSSFEERKILEKYIQKFNENPKLADIIMRKVYEKRNLLDENYLNSLILIDKEITKK